jgi:outer membrane protein assembly factor BamB
MPLTARCHSLRPEKTTGWLAYFELSPRGSRSGHFLVVGPASVERSDDVQSALRAGQATVRYLKEVPSHAPPVTLLQATARILAHESQRTGTALEYGCGVLEGTELWLLTRGSVRLVPLGPELGIPLGAEKPHAVSVTEDERFFLGRLPKGTSDERISKGLRARLEHGGGGDGGLVLQLMKREPIRAVENESGKESVDAQRKASPVFDSVYKELQHTFVFPESSSAKSEPATTKEEWVPHGERVEKATPGDSASVGSEASTAADSVTEDTPPKVVDDEIVGSGEEKVDVLANKEPSPPHLVFGDASARPEPGSDVYAPEETRGLGFWLAVVGAVIALGVLVTYLTVLRPHVRGAGETAPSNAETGGGEGDLGDALPPDNLAEARVWEDTFTEAVTSSPVVVNDRVVFGCRDGRVYALSRSDGRRIWAYAAPDGFGSSPSLCGALVVIGGYDGNIYALDATTGEERWVVRTKGRIVASPAVDENTAYVASYDHNLYAISVVDGRVIWNRDLGSVLWSSPAQAGGLLVAAGLDGKVHALNPKSGAVLWQADIGGPIYSSAAIGGGKVYIGSQAGYLYAIDGASGEVVWKIKAEGKVNGSPAYYDGHVVVGTDKGTIFGVDAETGNRSWTIDTEGEIRSKPAFQGRMVWVTGYDGFLHGIDWRAGEEVAKIRTDSSAFSSPAIRDGVAYFGAMDGRFFAIRVTGKPS